MSQLDITSVEKEIHNQFTELKDGLREMARAEAKGYVDPLITEKVEKANEAISKSEDLLEKAEKALALTKARKEVSGAIDEVPGLKDAWVSFIRKNDTELTTEQRHLMKTHTKSLNSASDPSGGYLVIPYFDTQVTQRLYETSPMRQVATVQTISTDQYEKPTQLDLAAAYWQDRDHDYVETTTQSWGRSTIRVHKLIAAPKISQDLLDDAYVDIETELTNSIVQSMQLLENTAFMVGTGKGQPRGIMTYAAGTTWGTIEQVVSGDANLITPDSLTNLVYSLKDGYTTNAKFLMARSTVSAIRKLKDTLGHSLWTPQFGNEPPQVMGYPVLRAADMPAVAAGALPVIFGDFRRAYIVVDRAGTRVLRNPYSNAPFVTFTTTRRVGGDVDNFEAVKILRIAAS